MIPARSAIRLRLASSTSGSWVAFALGLGGAGGRLGEPEVQGAVGDAQLRTDQFGQPVAGMSSR